ncbi:MAG: hypothetical protein M5U35_07285 [Roseovarius sp.]|nr:hypothetical protein [Roseovarius sp.]
MKSRTGAPYFHKSAATIKNRSPRASTEVAMKMPSGMPVQPDMMVMTL